MSLFKAALSEHMTPAPTDKAARATHPGQAHFAGSGPQDRTCHECLFWGHGKHDYHSRSGKYHGLIKPAPCMKFRMLTRKMGDKVPDDAPACRHFQQADTVPPRFDRMSKWS
jgi:hypothetical protein